MRALLFHEDERVRQFVATLNRQSADFGPSRAIGVMLNGELHAGIVYNEFRSHDLSMHVSAVSPRWASRKIVGALLAYPFVGLGCVRVTATIAETNDKARKLLRQLGFHAEGIHRLAWDGHEDALSFGMTRTDASRWIGEEPHGQEQSVHARSA